MADLFGGVKKFVDKNTKDLQKAGQQIIDQTRNVIDQNTDTLTKSKPLFGGPINLSGTNGGGKGAPSYSAPPININIPTPNLAPVQQAVETVTAPAVKAVEQVAQTAVQAVTPVVESVVDVAKVPVQAVEQITKIDPVDTTTNVVTQAVKTPEQVIGDAEPAVSAIADATADTIITATKVPEKINQIDAGKVAEDVVNQAVTTVTETPKMVVEIAENAVLKPASNLSMYLTEEAKDASELLWNNIIDPFQPGETQGTEGGGTDPALDANAPNLGDDKVYSDIETGTAKGSQMSEEERLRRIRRLLTNRYGREKTILGGAGDTTSRRRYAV
jgi:hypothetical protein